MQDTVSLCCLWWSSLLLVNMQTKSLLPMENMMTSNIYWAKFLCAPKNSPYFEDCLEAASKFQGIGKVRSRKLDEWKRKGFFFFFPNRFPSFTFLSPPIAEKARVPLPLHRLMFYHKSFLLNKQHFDSYLITGTKKWHSLVELFLHVLQFVCCFLDSLLKGLWLTHLIRYVVRITRIIAKIKRIVFFYAHIGMFFWIAYIKNYTAVGNI